MKREPTIAPMMTLRINCIICEDIFVSTDSLKLGIMNERIMVNTIYNNPPRTPPILAPFIHAFIISIALQTQKFFHHISMQNYQVYENAPQSLRQIQMQHISQRRKLSYHHGEEHTHCCYQKEKLGKEEKNREEVSLISLLISFSSMTT
jgi:hypothetical protein